MNYEKATVNIRSELRNYIQQNSIRSLIIGVSGGIDSALCCALAKPICDELAIRLIGRSLPIETNTKDEINNAKFVGENFCTDFKEFNLITAYNGFLMNRRQDDVSAETETKSKIRLGNIKARVRMIYLYDLAQKYDGMVLSTDNFTEYLLGFWTIAGDIGNYGMIQNLWKTEVYELAKLIWAHLAKMSDPKNSAKAKALESCIEAIPTDGLGISNSDLEQLGASTYEEVDKILKTWLVEDEDSFCWDDFLKYEGREKTYEEFKKYRTTLKEHSVIRRHERTHFKRNDPYNIPRNKLC